MTYSRPNLLWDVTLFSEYPLNQVDPGNYFRTGAVPINNADWRKYKCIPYCFDFPNAQLLYSVGVNSTQASEATFHYLFLREKTKQLISVPWEVRISEGLEDVPSPIFIFSPGRCGSTLLGNLVRCMGAISFSEPDFYTQAVSYSRRCLMSNIDPSEVVQMLPYLNSDLIVPVLNREAREVVIKLRAEANYLPEIILSVCKSKPKTIFLIRHFHEWAESTMKFGGNLDQCLYLYTLALDCYRYLQQNSDCLLIRYEDLRKDNKVLLDKISQFLSLDQLSDLAPIFNRDAQEGTLVQKISNEGTVSLEIKNQIRLIWKNKMPLEYLDSDELSYLKFTS